MSNPPQGELGGNPPVPGSGENGGRRGGLSPELVEHRLNQLKQKSVPIIKPGRFFFVSCQHCPNVYLVLVQRETPQPEEDRGV